MKKTLPYLFLIILVCIAYGNTTQNSFHFDDIPSILEKPWVRGLDKIPDFIFSLTQRPLVILSFNINYAISEFEVWSYHIFNITLHLLVVFLVYRLGKLIQKSTTQSDTKILNYLSDMPFLAACIFAIHPLNTQAVTYISGRSSIMATVFYLASILLFFEGLYKKKTKKLKINYIYRFGSVFCFALGFLCKLIVISLPAVLFAYHYYFIYKQNIKSWWNQYCKLVYLVCVSIILAVSYKKIYGGGILQASAAYFSPLDYLRTQIAVIPFEYFRKMIFPFNLTIDSDFQLVTSWASALALGGMVILGIFLIIWIKLSATKDGFKVYGTEAFCFLWILITLSPTSSVVPLLDVSVEHRTYLPLVGFSIALASIMVRLNDFTKQKIIGDSGGILNTLKISRVVTGFILIFLMFFLVGAKERNKIWKDEISLWTDAKLKTPYKPRVYNNLGEAYDKLGDYDQAIKEFEAGLRLNPKYFYALSNLGNVYGKKKEYEKAIKYFKISLEEKSDYAPGHYNLAKALHMTGQPKKALESYRLAITYNPYFEEAFFNLGFLALELKQFEEAVGSFKKFLDMQPKNAKAHFGLGTAYSMLDKYENAKKHFESSIHNDPKFLFTYISLANLNMAKGENANAKKLLIEILLKKPDFADAHKNLGLIFLQENDFNNSSHHLTKYLELAPLAPDVPIIKSMLKNKTTNKVQ